MVLVPGKIKWLENQYKENMSNLTVLVPGKIKWLENLSYFQPIFGKF